MSQIKEADPYDEVYAGWRAKVKALMPEADFAEVWADGRCVYCSVKVNGVEVMDYSKDRTL